MLRAVRFRTSLPIASRPLSAVRRRSETASQPPAQPIPENHFVDAQGVAGLFMRHLGLLVPTAACADIAARVNRDASVSVYQVSIDGYNLHLVGAPLPDPESIERLLLVHGLQRAMKSHPERKLDLALAARDVFRLQDTLQMTAEERLRERLDLCKITLLPQHKGFDVSLTDVEEMFKLDRTRALAEPDPYDLEGLKNRVLAGLYNYWNHDLHTLKEFSGGIPVLELKRRLAEAGQTFDLPDACKSFELPSASVPQIEGDDRQDLTIWLREIMAETLEYTKTRLSNRLENSREHYDSMYLRLRRLIVAHLIKRATDDDINHVINTVWAFVNIEMHKLNAAALYNPATKPQDVVNAAFEDRLVALPGFVPVYRSRNRAPGAALLDSETWASANTVRALFYHLSNAGIFRSDAFSPLQRREFEANLTARDANPDSPPPAFRELQRKLFWAIHNARPVDAETVRKRLNSAMPDEILPGDHALLTSLRSDVTGLAGALTTLHDAPYLHFYGIRDERQQTFRAAVEGVIAICEAATHRLGHAATLTIPKSEVVNAYVEVVGALTRLVSTYDSMRHGGTQTARTNFGLYCNTYVVRREKALTVLGAIPRVLHKDQVMLASIFAANTPFLWHQIPEPMRAYLVAYPEDITHRFHLNAALQMVHLNAWPDLQQRMGKDLDRDAYKSAMLTGMTPMRLKIVPHPSTHAAVVVLLDSDRTRGFGGGVTLPNSETFLRFATEALHTSLGIPLDHIVSMTMAEEPKNVPPAEFVSAVHRLLEASGS